jgi:hypothetical protein
MIQQYVRLIVFRKLVVAQLFNNFLSFIKPAACSHKYLKLDSILSWLSPLRHSISQTDRLHADNHTISEQILPFFMDPESQCSCLKDSVIRHCSETVKCT